MAPVVSPALDSAVDETGQLISAGGARLGLDEAWPAWRRQMFHGFVFWTDTIGVQRIAPELQPDAHCRLLIGRIAQAMIDLDSVGSLR